MAAIIVVADGSYDRKRVEDFAAGLRSDPAGAAYFAAQLLGAKLLVPVRTTALWCSYESMSVWDQAGIIDEVRDILDAHLETAFAAAVAAARATAPVPPTGASAA